MTLFGSCWCPVNRHVSTTGCEKGLFCQQIACCSTQRREGTDPRLGLLADGLATFSPVSSAFLINIPPLAGIQSCWDLCFHAPLGRSHRCPAFLFLCCPPRVFWAHSALKDTEDSPMGLGVYCSNWPLYFFLVHL